MKVENDEKFGYIGIKAEADDDASFVYSVLSGSSEIPAENVTFPRTTIVTEEEFFNAHGYIFETDLKVEGTKLQVCFQLYFCV